MQHEALLSATRSISKPFILRHSAAVGGISFLAGPTISSVQSGASPPFWVYAPMQLLVFGACAAVVPGGNRDEREHSPTNWGLRDYPRAGSRWHGQSLPCAKRAL